MRQRRLNKYQKATNCGRAVNDLCPGIRSQARRQARRHGLILCQVSTGKASQNNSTHVPRCPASLLCRLFFLQTLNAQWEFRFSEAPRKFKATLGASGFRIQAAT